LVYFVRYYDLFDFIRIRVLVQLPSKKFSQWWWGV